MAEVFISYHERSAGGLGAQIADALEAGGITCWYAKRDISPGEDFARVIPTQIDACKVFLLILNEDAQKSKHIESELGLAFSRANHGEDITIFPIEIGDFEKESWIRYYLIHAQILKCALLDAERIQEVARRVAERLNRELKLPAKIILCGECGDKGNNVTYTLNQNGVLKIFGNGAMRDFMWDMALENQIRDTLWKPIAHVEIQEGVTSIGSMAFMCCRGLKSIAIPNSMTNIGSQAFYFCTGLKSIIIPDSVISIGNGAFFGCGLTSVAIPDRVTSIEAGTFIACMELKSVSVPAKAKIADNAFPDSVTVTRRA